MKTTFSKQLKVAAVLWVAASALANQQPKATPATPAGTPASSAPTSTATASPSPAAASSFALKVTPQRVATLSATGAKANEIGQALARELKIPVRMSALVARQTVTRKLTQVPLENLLLALAPQVYVDYEVRWERPEEWVGIEPTGLNEREPNTPVERKAFIVLAGSTDDETVTQETMAKDQAAVDEAKLLKDPPKEGPVLDVSVKNGLVSIRARKHMATAILLEVASKAGMGFETRGQLDESFVDLDVRGLPVDQLPGVLAKPGFGVLMRRNLTSGGTRPVAVLLGSAATKIK